MTASDESIAKCVNHYRMLVGSGPAPTALSQAPDSRLDVILEKAGVERRTSQILERLEQAFAAAGIDTFPSLSDPELASKGRVYFLDAHRPIDGLAPAGQLFRDEKTLEQFILNNWDWFADLRGLKLHHFKDQQTFANGRRIDFLCDGRKQGELVGIELKVRELDDRAVGQLQEYLDDLQGHAQDHGFTSARLIVISGQPDLSVKRRVETYAASRGLGVTFLLYRVTFTLEEHPRDR